MLDNAHLEELTLRQLRMVAQKYRVSRYSRMTKQELIENILSSQARQVTQEAGRISPLDAQTEVEASKYPGADFIPSLTDVDRDLGDLPSGYGSSRIMLLPRDPQWAYAYWDVPNEHKEQLRASGGQQLLLRLCDVTAIVFDGSNAHTMIEFPCDEMAREWYVPIPVSDRDFVVEIGYKTASGGWLLLACSAVVRIPAMYPANWVDDYFVSIPFSDALEGQSFAPPTPEVVGSAALGVSASLGPAQDPSQPVYPKAGQAFKPVVIAPHDAVFRYVAKLDAQAGSVDDSAFAAPGMASGAGFLGGLEFAAFGEQVALPTLPVLSLFSGLFSGEYYSAQYAERERSFWLVADAELIFYGATEPDATVTIGDQVIPLNPDGTFRYHYHFPDGLREAPIRAVAVDGEQTRGITMRFLRQTPLRHTNTKAEAVPQAY